MKTLVLVSSLLLAASCPIKPPVPGPSSTPTPAPTATPTPIPTPSACTIPDVGADPLSPRPPAQFTNQVNLMLVSLYGGDPQSRVVINESLQVSLAKQVAALRALGICAGIQTGADEICILENPGICQGYHTFTCGITCDKGVVGWAPGSVRDTWVGSLPPTPPVSTPTLKPTSTPIPVPTLTPTPVVNCPPSLDKIVIAVRDQASFIVDATPQTGNKDWCNANGFPGRNFCPMGVEGGDSRAFCENLFGPYTLACPGQNCFLNNNPLQAKVTKPTPGGLVSFTAANQVSGSGQVPASN